MSRNYRPFSLLPICNKKIERLTWSYLHGHVTYLFWSLYTTVRFFGGKRLEPSMGKTKEKKKNNTNKTKKEKQPFLLLFHLCCLKNSFFTVITFWGKIFREKVSFSSIALYIFSSKVFMTSKLHVHELKIYKHWNPPL